MWWNTTATANSTTFNPSAARLSTVEMRLIRLATGDNERRNLNAQDTLLYNQTSYRTGLEKCEAIAVLLQPCRHNETDVVKNER